MLRLRAVNAENRPFALAYEYLLCYILYATHYILLSETKQNFLYVIRDVRRISSRKDFAF